VYDFYQVLLPAESPVHHLDRPTSGSALPIPDCDVDVGSTCCGYVLHAVGSTAAQATSEQWVASNFEDDGLFAACGPSNGVPSATYGVCLPPLFLSTSLSHTLILYSDSRQTYLYQVPYHHPPSAVRPRCGGECPCCRQPGSIYQHGHVSVPATTTTCTSDRLLGLLVWMCYLSEVNRVLRRSTAREWCLVST